MASIHAAIRAGLENETLRPIIDKEMPLAEAAKAAGGGVVGKGGPAQPIQDGGTGFRGCLAAPPKVGLVGPLGHVLGPAGAVGSPRCGAALRAVGRLPAAGAQHSGWREAGGAPQTAGPLPRGRAGRRERRRPAQGGL